MKNRFDKSSLFKDSSETDPRDRARRIRKTLQLGIFDARMSSITLAVVGLNAKDAVELLDRKIHRALRAESLQLKLIFDFGPKMLKALNQYLDAEKTVKEFFFDEDRPGILYLSLHPQQ